MWGPTTLRASKTRAELRRAPGAGEKLGSWRNAKEAESIAADDLPEVGWREAEGFEEAPSVPWKVEGEVSGAGRGDASEGEILQKHSELLVVGGVLWCWCCWEFWRSVRDDNRGFGPSGGSGGQAERKLDVVAVGDHIRARRAGAEPSGVIDEEAGADTPSHGITGGRKGTGCGEVLANGAESACQSPRRGLGNLLKLASSIHEKGSNRADRMFFHRRHQSREVRRREDGVVIDDEEVCKGRELGEGGLCGKGKASSEAEIFSGGKKLGGDGGVLDG
jgi:hypothetical protein